MEMDTNKIIAAALKGIALAMGIAVTVLMFLNEIGTKEAVSMLGIGLACLALNQFSNRQEDKRPSDLEA